VFGQAEAERLSRHIHLIAGGDLNSSRLVWSRDLGGPGWAPRGMTTSPCAPYLACTGENRILRRVGNWPSNLYQLKDKRPGVRNRGVP
jgi:hypothetical protein